jgi:hypothetical protein
MPSSFLGAFNHTLEYPDNSSELGNTGYQSDLAELSRVTNIETASPANVEPSEMKAPSYSLDQIPRE